jgi:predicted acylesterase/phospholipase RssA
MCATMADKGEAILLRSYTPPDPDDSAPVSSGARNVDFTRMTISQAARATSAAPTYLPELEYQGLTFWDGGLLNNNPIDQVWAARYDLASDRYSTPVVSCVLSIGTSYSTKVPRSIFRFFNTISKTISFSTNTEAKHRDFERSIRRANQRIASSANRTNYFRFNAPTGNDSINLDDWQRMPKLKKYTDNYLQQTEEQDKIDKCARLIAKV